MSVHAGTIILLAGNTVVDRVQSHGIQDARVPVDTVREIGNDEIVEKQPTEPDFTFGLNAQDMSTEIEALLTGQRGSGYGSSQAAGFGDADGTEYDMSLCGFQHFCSPWKDPATGSAGTVTAGHVIPGYYLRRIRYNFEVTGASTVEAELGGGSYFYGKASPKEQFFTGDASTTAFVTSTAAVRHRKNGAAGTTFKAVLGVIVDGVLQSEGSDYTLSGGGPISAATVATVTFAAAPATGAKIWIVYFTTTASAYPNAVHASTVVKPGQVRGRNVCVSISPSASTTWTQVGSIQSASLEHSVDGTVERELCNEEIVGFTVNGRDTNGQVVVRSKTAAHFFALMERVTGVDTDEEVLGWLNTNQVKLKIEIQHPKTGAVLKTLYVRDAVFSIPGTPAQVNSPTDFQMGWESDSGTFKVFKGAMS